MRILKSILSLFLILGLLSACNPFAKKGDDSFVQSLSDKLKGKKSENSDWSIKKEADQPHVTPPPVQNGNTLISEDKKSQISLLAGWSKVNDLNDKADMQMSNPSKSMYFIVLSESKGDFDSKMTLEKHSDITRKSLKKSLSGIEEQGPFHTVINGKPAVQYEIVASFKTLKVGYLHTTVETDKNFHQLLSWTTLDKFKGAGRKTIDQVMNSFQER